MISDDNGRNGGTWGANSMGPVNLVLDFWGESQTISKFRLFRNVGIDISILEELVKDLRFYISDDKVDEKLRRKDDDIDGVEWKLVFEGATERAEGWQDFVLEAPKTARFVRIEMVRSPHLPTPGETVKGSYFKMGPGGKGFNQCVAAYKAGADAVMISRVGEDSFANVALDTMKALGMKRDYMFVSAICDALTLLLEEEDLSLEDVSYFHLILLH